MMVPNLNQGTPNDILAAALLSLLRFRLSPREQTVLRAVILAPTPLTAWELAKRTRIAYSHVKATVRMLIDWGMLTRNSEGLCFQSEPSRWGPPTVPVLPNDVETDRSPKATLER